MSTTVLERTSEPRPAAPAQRRRRLIVAHETNGRKYFAILAQVAAREGLELEFVETMIERELLRRALRARRWPSGALGFLARNWRFRLAVPAIRNAVVLLGMGPWDPRMAWYGLLARHNRVLYYASWPDWSGNRVPRRFGPLNGLLARRWGQVLSGASAEVAAANAVCAASFKARFPNAKVRVIPHDAHRSFYEVERTTTAPDGPLRLAQVGELSVKKGLRLWPRILDRLAADCPVEVDVYGDGELEGEVRAMGARYPVRAHGFVGSPERLAQRLAASDVLLVPSQRTDRWEELFGMVVIEAQAAGVVPIASNHVGPADLITDGVDGFLVDEQDVDGFAARIRELARDRARLGRMSAAAREAAQRYHPDVVVEAWRTCVTGEMPPCS